MKRVAREKAGTPEGAAFARKLAELGVDVSPKLKAHPQRPTPVYFKELVEKMMRDFASEMMKDLERQLGERMRQTVHHRQSTRPTSVTDTPEEEDDGLL